MFEGLKLSLLHATVYAPFYAKAEALESGRPFLYEYAIRTSRATMFFTCILSATFGMRHTVFHYKDQMRFTLQYHIPYIRSSKQAQNTILYCGFTFPLGFAIYYANTGKILRGGGGMMWTLFLAFSFNWMENG